MFVSNSATLIKKLLMTEVTNITIIEFNMNIGNILKLHIKL